MQRRWSHPPAPRAAAVALVVVAFWVAAGCSSRPIGRFVGHAGSIVAATFSPDGRMLASIGQDGTVRVWEVQSQRELARASIDSPPRQYTMDEVAFAPDGSAVAFAAGGDAVYWWHWRTGEPPERLFQLRGLPSKLAFSSDGRRLVAASGGYGPALTTTQTQVPVTQPLDVRVYDVRQGRVVTEHRDDDCAPLSVAVAPDSGRFAVVCLTVDGRPMRDFVKSGEAHARLCIRDLSTGEELAAIEGEGNALLAYASGGDHLFVGDRVRDGSTGALVRQVELHPRMIVNDGRRVLVIRQGFGVPWDIGLVATPWIEKVRVDLESGRSFNDGRLVMKGRSPMPLLPPLSPDGRLLVDYDLNLWQLPR